MALEEIAQVAEGVFSTPTTRSLPGDPQSIEPENLKPSILYVYSVADIFIASTFVDYSRQHRQWVALRGDTCLDSVWESIASRPENNKPRISKAYFDKFKLGEIIAKLASLGYFNLIQHQQKIVEPTGQLVQIICAAHDNTT